MKSLRVKSQCKKSRENERVRPATLSDFSDFFAEKQSGNQGRVEMFDCIYIEFIPFILFRHIYIYNIYIYIYTGYPWISGICHFSCACAWFAVRAKQVKKDSCACFPTPLALTQKLMKTSDGEIKKFNENIEKGIKNILKILKQFDFSAFIISLKRKHAVSTQASNQSWRNLLRKRSKN